MSYCYNMHIAIICICIYYIYILYIYIIYIYIYKYMAIQQYSNIYILYIYHRFRACGLLSNTTTHRTSKRMATSIALWGAPWHEVLLGRPWDLSSRSWLPPSHSEATIVWGSAGSRLCFSSSFKINVVYSVNRSMIGLHHQTHVDCH